MNNPSCVAVALLRQSTGWIFYTELWICSHAPSICRRLHRKDTSAEVHKSGWSCKSPVSNCDINQAGHIRTQSTGADVPHAPPPPRPAPPLTPPPTGLDLMISLIRSWEKVEGVLRRFNTSFFRKDISRGLREKRNWMLRSDSVALAPEICFSRWLLKMNHVVLMTAAFISTGFLRSYRNPVFFGQCCDKKMW